MHLLMVINSNLGSILPRFRDNCRFSAEKSDHAYFTRILGLSPLDQIDDIVTAGAKTQANYSCNYFRI